MVLLVLCLWLVVSCVDAQVTPGFTCVPTGTCRPTPPTGAGTIDPRIVTPVVCPPGTEPCPTGTGTTGQCGQRVIPPPTDADGVATAGAFPWQAFLVNQSNLYFGSGAVLDQFNVLTVAHKVAANRATPGNIRVFIGVFDPTVLTNVQQKTAVRIEVHPNFNPTSLQNDIAIIRLDSAIPLGTQPNIGCVNLPTQGQSFVGQTKCIVSGWGQSQFTINDSPTRPQKQVTIPIVDYQTCRTAMAQPNILGTAVDTYLDAMTTLCAGGQLQKDACTNDGGAPLVCPDANSRWTVAGLVAWGKGCGNAGVYGAYTNVANYRTWIDTTVASMNAG